MLQPKLSAIAGAISKTIAALLDVLASPELANTASMFSGFSWVQPEPLAFPEAPAVDLQSSHLGGKK